MTTSKFRSYVNKVAKHIRDSHKWRKAETQFSGRHHVKGWKDRINLGCIKLSKNRVWWIFDDTKLDASIGYEEVRKYIESVHKRLFSDQMDYKVLFGVTLIDGDVPGSILDETGVAEWIIAACRTNKKCE